MSEQIESLTYEFSDFIVDATRRRLMRKGTSIPLTSKAFDTLLMLVSRRGTTVSKLELMNSVWADTAVEENNLTQQISALRRALGERPHDHRFIVTVPGRGYCFVAEILRHQNETLPNNNGHRQSVTDGRSKGWYVNLDAGAIRGYSLAILMIAVVCGSVVLSIFRNSGPDHQQSLAVLNFKVSASGDEFIGSGISETLRARLGSVQDLTVRPGDSVSADQDALVVGRRLQVDTVVTGSVQRDHDRIRVVVEMLDVAGERIVWGRTFDDSASNLFALQDSIAGEVERELNAGYISSADSSNIPLRLLTELPNVLSGARGTLLV